MKIAITADPFIPVPPENYGGIERIIDFLVRGLSDRGHDVVLVAHAASTVNTKLLPYESANASWMAHFKNTHAITQLRKFNPEVIHSFSRLAYLVPFLRSPVPKVMSYQREPTLSQIRKAVKFATRQNIIFTGCSNYISEKIRPEATAYTVYNGVEIDKYDFVSKVDENAPLVFLGRIEAIKGVKTAIEVAISAKKRLIIAGNIPADQTAYFENQVKPLLTKNIEYIGEVNDMQKNKLLGSGLALLMPITWNEPFGIVMAEAMACGTPVIGFNKGAVPEIIRHGINGYRCDTQDEMVDLVQKISAIDRHHVRLAAENRFSAGVVIEEYLKVYHRCLS